MHKAKVIPCLAIVLIGFSCLVSAGTHSNIANRCKRIVAFPNVAFNSPQKLIDGKSDTYWYSEPKAPVNWVEIDFGQPVHLDRMLLKGVDNMVAMEARFTIQAWHDYSWSTLFEGLYPEEHFFTFQEVRTTKLRLEIENSSAKVQIAEWEIYPTVESPVLCNQIGFLPDWPKRFTVLGVPDGTPFKIIRTTNWEVVYKGKIFKNVGDFTAWEPVKKGTYIAEVNFESESRSFPFEVKPFLYERIAYPAALKFMTDSRTNWGDKSTCAKSATDCPHLNSGYGWRGSTPETMDIASLLALFLSNPSGITNLPSDPVHFYEGSADKPESDLPELIKLLHWGIHILLGAEKLSFHQYHQLAWFAWSWPWLLEYFDRELYIDVRDRLLSYYTPTFVSSSEDFSSDQFVNNYLAMGNADGASLLSQLFMWEVCRRDSLSEETFFLENSERILKRILHHLEKEFDTVNEDKNVETGLLDIPAIVMYLRYFPDKAPLIRPKIEDWARFIIAYSDPTWDVCELHNGFFSFPAAALSASSVLHDQRFKTELKRLAMGHFDHVFGRNIFGRHFSYHATSDFEGADLGWFTQSADDPDLLNNTRGLLDGQPMTDPAEVQNVSCMTESDLEKQIAWNFGLAYLGWTNTEVFATFSTYDKDEHLIRWTDTLFVQLQAPVNVNSNLVEQASVSITTDRGDKETITLLEISPDNPILRNEIPLSKSKKIQPNDGKVQARKGDLVTVNYGGAGFQNSYTLIMGR